MKEKEANFKEPDDFEGSERIVNSPIDDKVGGISRRTILGYLSGLLVAPLAGKAEKIGGIEIFDRITATAEADPSYEGIDLRSERFISKVRSLSSIYNGRVRFGNELLFWAENRELATDAFAFYERINRSSVFERDFSMAGQRKKNDSALSGTGMRDPLERLDFENSNNLEIDSSLIDPDELGAECLVHPLKLEIRHGQGEHEKVLDINLFNLLEGPDPVYVRSIPERKIKNDITATREAESVIRAIRNATKKGNDLLAKVVSGYREEKLFPIRPVEEGRLSEEAMRELNRIIQKTSMFKIEFVPRGEDLDRFERVPPESRPGFFVTPELISELGGRPLSVDGQVRKITLVFPRAKIDGDARDKGLYLDKYGNSLSSKQTEEGLELVIEPQTKFVESGENSGGSPVNLDLSKYGIDEIEGFLIQREEEPLRFRFAEFPYKIYAKMSSKQREMVEQILSDEGLRKSFEAKAGGMKNVEQAFGFDAGTVLKNICISNSVHARARFQPRDFGTVYGSFASLTERVPQLYPWIHDGSHAVMVPLGIGSHDAIKDLFSGWKEDEDAEEFYAKLNEGSFLMERLGGHSEDNEEELIASLVTSLFHPELIERLRDITKTEVDPNNKVARIVFIRFYRKALEAFREALEDRADGKMDRFAHSPWRRDDIQLKKKSRIFNMINRAISEVERLESLYSPLEAEQEHRKRKGKREK